MRNGHDAAMGRPDSIPGRTAWEMSDYRFRGSSERIDPDMLALATWADAWTDETVPRTDAPVRFRGARVITTPLGNVVRFGSDVSRATRTVGWATHGYRSLSKTHREGQDGQPVCGVAVPVDAAQVDRGYDRVTCAKCRGAK